MKKNKRVLCLFVVVTMLVQLFGITGITSVSAASTVTYGSEKDFFALLEGKGYLAVAADGDGTSDVAIGMKVRDNEYGARATQYSFLHDVSEIEIDANNNLVESDALTEVVSKLYGAKLGLTEDDIRNVITYAKINKASNYVGYTMDGAYLKTTRTDVDGANEKSVWYTQSYYRYRTPDKGGDATYKAEYTGSYGPYVYATDSRFNNETNLTFIVEYFDEGTDTVKLNYATTATKVNTNNGKIYTVNNNSLSITKTNTNKWQTAIFSVTDANFSTSNIALTGFVGDQDDLRFEPGWGNFAISRFMVVKTSDYLEALNSSGPERDDFSAFEYDGIYSYAGNDSKADTEFGLSILGYNEENSTEQLDTRIYHYVNDKAIIDQEILSDAETDDEGFLQGAYNKLVELNNAGRNFEWITRGSDGAWKYKSIDGQNAFWTTKNVRNHKDDDGIVPGAFYFRPTNDVINENISDITFIVEYYDDNGHFDLQYCNRDFTNNGIASVSSVRVKKNNTSTWKKAVIQVTDAKIDKDWIMKQGLELDGTALGNGCASVKIKGSGSEFYLGRILIIPTAKYNRILRTSLIHNDGTDWWDIAEKKGAYVDASLHTNGQGVNMSAITSERLYDLQNAADVQELGTDTKIAGKTVSTIIAENQFRYVTNSDKDSAMMFSTATSGDNKTRRTMFSSHNMRDASKSTVGGYLYFSVTNSEMFTSSDDELYILVEYLDYHADISIGTNNNYTSQAPFVFKYFANDTVKTNDKTFGTSTIKRYNSNKWKTIAIPVTDAEFTTTNDTGLQNGCEFRLECKSKDLHVSRVGIVKASDVGIASPVPYNAPVTQDAAPTIWLMGDSIVEKLKTVTNYPRTGWGMELENYFIRKSDGPLNPNGETSTIDGFAVANKVTDGVTVINKAKGGKSTRSFLGEYDSGNINLKDTRWSDIKTNAKKGDYLFMSFGYNDANNRHYVQTNPYSIGDDGDRTSLRANIREFKAAADERGVNFVILTSAATMNLENGKFSDSSQASHVSTIRAMGRQLGIPVLDVHENHIELIEMLGAENYTRIFNYYGDDAMSAVNPLWNKVNPTSDKVHINQTGAKEICKIIINEIKEKSDVYPSLNALKKWINPSIDTTPMTAPVKQTENVTYGVSNARFRVNGVESSTYAPGQVEAIIEVTNNTNAERKVILYTAVYDKEKDLVKATATTPVTLSPGQKETLTSDPLTLPDTEGYTFNRFIWDGDMVPYNEDDNKVTLFAEGYNRRAVLSWKTNGYLGDVTFKLYRNGELIATTKNYGYVDDGIERGTYQYELNCYNVNGKLIYQKKSTSIVNVTSIYDVGYDAGGNKNPNVFYVKANLDSEGIAADITHGIKKLDTGELVPSNQAQAHFGTIGNNQDYKTVPYVGSSATDGDSRRVLVTDSFGISKYAWNTNRYYSKGQKETVNGSIYIDKDDTTGLSASDSKIYVYVEFLGNVSQLKLEYASTDKDENGEYIVKEVTPDITKISNGEWRAARYEIDGIYLGEENHPFYYASPFRFHCNGDKTLDDEVKDDYQQDIYISSVLVVKSDDKSYADTVYGKLNNLEYNDRKVRDASAKYPDGASITFEDGMPNGIGMNVYPDLNSETADCSGEYGIDDNGVGYYATREIYNNKQTFLYFSVDRDYVFGASDHNLVLEVTYKVDKDTQLNVRMPRYDKDTDTLVGDNQLSSHYITGGNEWHTTTINLNNAGIIGATDNRAIEFRLFIDKEAGQLKVSKVAVKNADHLPVQYIQ